MTIFLLAQFVSFVDGILVLKLDRLDLQQFAIPLQAQFSPLGGQISELDHFLAQPAQQGSLFGLDLPLFRRHIEFGPGPIVQHPFLHVQVSLPVLVLLLLGLQ